SSMGDFGFAGDADDMVPRPQVAFAFMAGEDDQVVDPPELPPVGADPPDPAGVQDPPRGGGVLEAAGAAEDAVAERDNSDKALQLERFSGNKRDISLTEWKRRFTALATVKRWTWPTTLNKLRAFLTGNAARIVDYHVLPANPRDAVAEIWSALGKAFGLTPSQAVHKLRTLQFEVGTTQIDDVASRIAEWSELAWPFLTSRDRDCVAASILWSSLPKTAQVKHAFSQ
ncbi:hypothetical protein FOL47_004839, partial [Perkinsus chesapeaki]